MDVIYFIFFLGILNILFNFIWEWIVMLPVSALFVSILPDRYLAISMRPIKVIGTYLFTSLAAILVLDIFGKTISVEMIVALIIGSLVLFTAFARNYYKSRRDAYANNRWFGVRILRENAYFDSLLTFGSVALFIFLVIFPELATNMITEGLNDFIVWVYNIPTIGFLLNIGGVLFLLSTLFTGFFAIGFVSVPMLKLLGFEEKDFDKDQGKQNDLKI